LHQVGDLFELNVKLLCQKLREGTEILSDDHCSFDASLYWILLGLGDLFNATF
jgi:hypothetical protein